jgi:hypothetical protein
MTRLITRGVVATALLVGIGAAQGVASAGAAAPPLQQVSISGLICRSGDVLDVGVIFVGFQSNRGYQVLVRKAFNCDDGSGTIFVKIQVHGSNDGTETFNWVVLGGTGAYGGLHGSGGGTTVPNADPSTGNTNFYTGFLVG